MLSFVIIFVSCIADAQNKTTFENSWTKTPIEITGAHSNENDENVLQKVRAGNHSNFDRLVFEFRNKSVPESKINFAGQPFRFGESDKTVKINGKSFPEIVMTPAYARDIANGKVTVNERES